MFIYSNGGIKMSKIIDNNKFRLENQTQVDIDEIKLINMIASNLFFISSTSFRYLFTDNDILISLATDLIIVDHKREFIGRYQKTSFLLKEKIEKML